MTAALKIMENKEQDQPEPRVIPLDIDRELDRWFALCRRDKAFRRAFTMILNNGYGSIKTEMHGRRLRRVISEVVFVAEGD